MPDNLRTNVRLCISMPSSTYLIYIVARIRKTGRECEGEEEEEEEEEDYCEGADPSVRERGNNQPTNPCTRRERKRASE